MDTFFIVEASHLFRAGEIHSSQLYVIDVVNYIAREIMNSPVTDTWVLFGSTKEQQADKYVQAVERTGVKVIRMAPIDSRIIPGNKFYKPSTYLHDIFATLPDGSQVVLVGFHNTRFEDLLKKYQHQFQISICAFTTKSKTNNDMRIPENFIPLLTHAVSLDDHISGIKGEYKRSKQAEVQ
jgi:CTP:phosphocholine cytidylyltransferase-like protein